MANPQRLTSAQYHRIDHDPTRYDCMPVPGRMNRRRRLLRIDRFAAYVASRGWKH